MELLERETHLDTLRRAFDDCAAPRGRTALVAGEAGIGKTALIERFTRDVGAAARVLWGACEALFTPRPLGPFYDVVHALGGPLAGRLQGDAKPVDLFHGLLEAIRSHERPSVIVLEDVHWADHATLDFLRFIARRITRLPALLVCTYRDEEVGAQHPLTAVLGEIPRADRLDLKLPAFSPATCERLARAAGYADAGVFRVTGGNPFFVTELISSGAGELAPSVRQAVLSRARHLSAAARDLLDLVSVVPDRLELTLLEGPLAADLGGLEECAERGLLVLGDAHVGFRHELARMAIEGSLTPIKRARLNRRILDALAAAPADARSLARLAHHALGARDPASVLRYAPEAARAATARGAHREAAALVASALPYAERLAPAERAAFYELRARTAFIAGQPPEAIAASEAAHALWQSLDARLARGRNLLQRCEWLFASELARRDEARRIADEALGLLEAEGAPAEVALARIWMGFLVSPRDPVLARVCLDEVMRARDTITDPLASIEILGRMSLLEATLLGSPTPATVTRMFEIARKHDLDQGLLSAYRAAAQAANYNYDMAGVGRILDEALGFADNRQLDRYLHTQILRTIETELAFYRGEWGEAERRYAALTAAGHGYWSVRMIHTRLRLAPLYFRTGRPEGAQWLDEAQSVAAGFQPIETFALARAELERHWLAGDDARLRAALDLLLASTWGADDHPWARGERSFWRWVAGEGDVPTTNIAEPFRLAITGDARGAAAAWTARGMPYEAGLALAFGDEDAQRAAIRIFESLGARVAVERVRERMRAQGLRSVPSGPRPSTRANPAGLTERELEVLVLLAAGKSNADIAAQLHRSVRTVENHVASLTGKLGVDGRLAAVAAARARGMLTD